MQHAGLLHTAWRTILPSGITPFVKRYVRRCGISQGAIHDIIVGETWAHIGGAKPVWQGTRNKGEKHPQAKLTENDVRTIRNLYAQGGVTYEALGKQFGVTGSAIYHAVKRVTWKHI